MFGGGDQKRTSEDSEISPQLPNNPRAMVISNSSAALDHAGQNSPHVFAGEDVQNGALSQQAESILIHSKKLQDDLQELGQKIKHHEDNVRYLATQKIKLEESILDMTATLEKYHKTSFSAIQNQDLDLTKSEQETLGNILKHEKSAAALLCMIKSQPESQASDHPLTKDVLGIVATLGKVDDDNLSRLLSEYLGLETMLAVVCKTYEGVKALEAYNKEGLINKSLGLHALAASIGRSLDDPFLVICLERLRPYPGEFIANDPQRRLDILKPRIISGETPPGFLGFAVNMINIDRTHLYYITKSGFGLRETLFYNLLSRLQVYRSREDMLKALPYIPDGAISLDGGMIRSPGIFRLGPPREDVKFPIGFESLSLPDKYLEIKNQIKETTWKKNRMVEDLHREQSYLDHAKVNYEMKKQEFVKFLAESSMYTAQVARASAPR
ncbi:protein DEFECTIVE IN MERISTEM SILENCING 3-like isoform X1 [Primulina huaijiensis]|uniref:protein DEFECTIVE IN MERISTEM SILENCING 3-like isoform X1 n=2 Tax=Primulina huaijiensis TaxID=1492673 RepID=UPI003CC6F53D